MTDPVQPDPDAPSSAGSRLPLERAVVLIGLFIIATVLLLGQIHPTSSSSSGGGTATPTTAPSGTTTTTAAPAGSTTTTTTAPKAVPNVPVMVANASGTAGAAATVTNQLQLAGWTVQSPVNASTHVTSSSVYYVQGQKAAALTLASTLHLPSSAVAPYTTAAPISSIGTAELLVVVGPDLVAGGSGTSTGT
jgi:hypothetical protein